jgi:hypothetical protein
MAMASLTEMLKETPHESARPQPQAASSPDPVILPWLRAQAINVTRHAAALRPFRADEFGTGAEAPTAGHLQAVNKLIRSLRSGLLHMSGRARKAAAGAIQKPSTPRLQDLMRKKEQAHYWVRGIEKIWDFYFELFGQRQTRYARWLLSCDRIGLDCYRAYYLGLGVARPLPSPPPFSYMATGFSPATFRRGIPLKKLGKQLNPFPLVQLPYHRLVNPWTLGAVLHEISHNLQNDLGLNRDIPRKVGSSLLKAGFSRHVARTWVRWNREMFADLSAVLLGGPNIGGSLMDILARGPQTVVAYLPRGPHPTAHGLRIGIEPVSQALAAHLSQPARRKYPSCDREVFFRRVPGGGRRDVLSALPHAWKPQPGTGLELRPERAANDRRSLTALGCRCGPGDHPRAFSHRLSSHGPGSTPCPAGGFNQELLSRFGERLRGERHGIGSDIPQLVRLA